MPLKFTRIEVKLLFSAVKNECLEVIDNMDIFVVEIKTPLNYLCGNQ